MRKHRNVGLPSTKGEGEKEERVKRVSFKKRGRWDDLKRKKVIPKIFLETPFTSDTEI
jgi:hypothetical protein